MINNNAKFNIVSINQDWSIAHMIEEDNLLPTEIKDVDNFINMSELADFCRIKRVKDVVKLKLRTPYRLYTLKVNLSEADEIIKKLKCETGEV